MYNSEETSTIRTSEAVQKIIRSDCVVKLENIDHITGLLPKNCSIRVSQLKSNKVSNIKKRSQLRKAKVVQKSTIRTRNLHKSSPAALLKLKIANKLRAERMANSDSQSNETKVSDSSDTTNIINGKGKHVAKVASESNNEMVVFNDKYINNEEMNCTEGFLTNTEGVVEVNIQDIMEKNLEGAKLKEQNFKVVPFIDPEAPAEPKKVESENEVDVKKRKEAVMDSVEASISKMFMESKTSDSEETARSISPNEASKGSKRKPQGLQDEGIKKKELKPKNQRMRRNNEILRLKSAQLRGLRSSIRRSDRDILSNSRYRQRVKPNYKQLAGIISKPTKDLEKNKKVEPVLKPKFVPKVVQKKRDQKHTQIKTKSTKIANETKPTKVIKPEITPKHLRSSSTPNLSKSQSETRYKLVVPKSFNINDLQFQNNQLVYAPKKKENINFESNRSSPSPAFRKESKSFPNSQSYSKENKAGTPSLRKLTNEENKRPIIPSLNKEKQPIKMNPKNLIKYTWKDNTIETWRKRKFKLAAVVKVWEIKPDPLFGIAKNTVPKQNTKTISMPSEVNGKNNAAPKTSKINAPDLTKLNAAIPKDLSYVDFVKRYEENKKLYNELSETYKADVIKQKEGDNLENPKGSAKVWPKKSNPISSISKSSNYIPKGSNNKTPLILNQNKSKINSIKKKPIMNDLKDLEDELECNIIMTDAKENSCDEDGDDEREGNEIDEEEMDEEDMEDYYNMDDSDNSNSEMYEDYGMDEDDSELEYLCRLSLPHKNDNDSKTNDYDDMESQKEGTEVIASNKKEDFTEAKIVIFQDMLDQVQKVRLPDDWELRCTEFGITFLSSDRFVTVSANLDINVKMDNKDVELMGAPKNVSCIEDLSIVLDIISTIENDDFMLVYK